MESIADRLERLMHGRGIRSQNHLARECGVAQSSINRLLKHGDDYAPRWQTLLRLAEYFQVSPTWLAEGRGSPDPHGQTPLLPGSSSSMVPQLQDSALLDATEVREAMQRFARLDAEGRQVVLSLLRWIESR